MNSNMLNNNTPFKLCEDFSKKLMIFEKNCMIPTAKMTKAKS